MTSHRPVYVVTDSGADIPPALLEQLKIRVVPLTITFGDQSFKSGVDITSQQFIDKLRTDRNFPKTAAPSSQAFADAYREIIDQDGDVVCVTISSGLSGTFNAARLGAEEFPSERVRVVDSLGMCMQEGWVAVDTARAAIAGETLDECEAVALSAVERAECFAVLATLDYAYKGGRIGRASHIVGSALGIKPVINFIDGVLTPLERVRTWKRAIARARDLAAESNPQDIAVLHSDNEKDAETIADELRQRCPDANVIIGWCGPTITTYAGPGAIGILVLRKP